MDWMKELWPAVDLENLVHELLSGLKLVPSEDICEQDNPYTEFVEDHRPKASQVLQGFKLPFQMPSYSNLTAMSFRQYLEFPGLQCSQLWDGNNINKWDFNKLEWSCEFKVMVCKAQLNRLSKESCLLWFFLD